jgi:hypothetical protein
MADSKISALPASTTPLAGTEVLPIVQSSTTKQVSVANLTAGRAVSALSVTTTTDASFATTSGNVGVGTASPSNKLTVYDTSAPRVLFDNGTSTFIVGNSFGGNNHILYGTGAYPMIFYTNAAETMRIDAAGIVTMSAYGAGAATFSAAGVISSVSDETWKTKDGVPANPDAMLQKLEPGYWFYNDEKKETFGADRQLGFYAQNVHEAIGEEAAPTPEKYKDENGNNTDVSKPWGYYDRSVLAVTVMSLKNALSTIEELKQRITALENK